MERELVAAVDRASVFGATDVIAEGAWRPAHVIFEEQARRAPSATAVVMGGERLDYATLDRRANHVAHRLRALGVGAESRVAICLGRSIERMVAVLGVMKAGGAYVPLDPAYPAKRLAFMLEDMEARVVLTARRWGAVLPEGVTALCFGGEGDGLDGESERPPESEVTESTLAYVIYTSGSTGVPKGVMIEHGSLAGLIAAQGPIFGVGPESRILQFASPSFDVSVSDTWLAWGAGAALHLASADELAPGPGLVRLLREQGITHVGLPPSALSAMPDAVLPALRVIISAGEACPPDLPARWGAGRRFFNAYGPTEATVYTTVYECRPGETRVPIGRPIAGRTVVILDRDGRPVEPGEPGELCIGGGALARGYWRRPELTARAFVRLEQEGGERGSPGERGSRLYRTGDLARMLPDGDVEYLGRLDHQVKIRGFRVELGEIEAVLRRCASVRDVVVVGHEDAPGRKRLVAYVVRRSGEARGAGPIEWRRSAEEHLPAYMVPAVFVELPALPLSPSGKVDRAALPPPGPGRPEVAAAYVAPRTETERSVAAIWSDVLGVSPVGVEDDFFELGGDSLSATRVLARVHEAHGVELTVRDLFDARSVAGLAGRVEGAARSPQAAAAAPIVPIDRGGELPLSFAQQRLWFLHQLAPESAAYHVPCLVRLRGPVDVDALARSLTALVARHEALRARIVVHGERPSLVIDPPGDVALPVHDLRSAAEQPSSDLGAPAWGGLASGPAERRASDLEALVREELTRPFDLAQGPLFRARLVRVADEEYTLILCQHHVASDGWSLRVLLRDLAELYGAACAGRAARLPDLAVQYVDHAAWQRARYERGELAGQLAFWREELSGAPPRLDLPADRPRPAVQRFRGAQHVFKLSGGIGAALEGICRAEGATPFMALFAALNALLHRYTGAEDIVVGTPTAGRGRREIEDLVGFFANTLALRTRVEPERSFRELLRGVRDRVLAAFSNQDLPFERLVEELRVDRDPAYQPVFQVMFAYQEPPPGAAAGGVDFRASDADTGAAPFDLLWQVWSGERGLEGALVHDTDLFDPGTAAAMAGHLEALLDRIARAPDRPLSELLLLSDEEIRRAAALPAIEAELLAHPSVEDGAVLLRPAGTRGREIVAYVVPRGPAGASIAVDLSGRLPEALRPSAIVPIHAVPRTADGRIDERALRRVEVIDAGLLERWERRLRAVPGVEDAAAVAREVAPPQRTLHLSDLLPEPLAGAPPGEPREGLDAPAGEAIAAPAHDARGTTVVASPSFAARAVAVERPPAIADGGPLDIPDDAPRTLTAALLRTAETFADKGITIVPAHGEPTFLSYRELLREARRVLSGLASHGLGPGDRVILQIASLREHLAAFWACLLGGITPATVAVAPSYDAPNGVTGKLYNTWELCGRPAIVASARLVQPILGLRAFHPMDGARVLAIEGLREHAPAERIHEARPEDVAFLQLTSGSTGVPKCIQITHGGIVRHVHGGARANGYRTDDVSLNWLPFDHVVPILTVHLKDVYLGCCQVQIETDRILAEPLVWLDRMEAHRVTRSWSPNFGFKLVADALAAAPGRSWDLSSIVHLMNAGEQVTAPVARAFLRAAAPFGVRPEAMQPAFGMAEACTCITYQNTFDPETGVHRVAKASLGGALEMSAVEDGSTISFVDLGPPIPGVEIRITDAENRVLPEGTIGRMQIRGGVVTPGYLNNEAANREAFVGDGWFNSGDLGFLLGGRLTLTGREKETIIVRGANFYCHEIEDVVNGVPGVEPTFAAACAVEDPAHGTEGLAIFFVPRGGARDEGRPLDIGARARLAQAVRAEVTAKLGVVPAVVLPIARDGFPKTTSGKIQRSSLKRALREGRFAQLQKEIDLALGGPATLPDWFFEPAFEPREAGPTLARAPAGATLLFLDRRGLGERLAAALREEGRRVVTVRPGSGFEEVGPGAYAVELDRLDDHARLLGAIEASVARVDHVIHLASYDGERPAPAGLDALARAGADATFGLLSLTQALVAAAGGARGSSGETGRGEVRLTVVSDRAQQVFESEPIACEKAPLLGVLRTIPQEIPWLDARHVDVLGEDLAADLAAVRGELGALRRDREIAHRGGRRWALGLRKIDLASRPAGPSPFVTGGAYLVTGGLGGIGARLAELLLTRFGARVLVVGRTPVGEAVRAVHALVAAARRSGGDVIHEVADVADAAALAAVVERAEARWGRPLDGVIHLAGVMDARTLAEETPETFAATLRPKVLGGLAVRALLQRRPGAAFVAISSVNAFFGGFSAGAYAAANRFVEHLAHALAGEGRARVHCVAFSRWDDVGMSRHSHTAELGRARGYQAIPAAKGIGALLAALHRGPVRTMAGLDGASPHVLRHVHGAPPVARRVLAWVAGTEVGIQSVNGLEVRDRLGARSAAEVRVVDSLPRTPEGAADVEALLDRRGDEAPNGPAKIAPRDEVESTVARIWQEVLGLDRVGANDSFFGLGGHSMLLAQARLRLEKAFGRSIAVVELFRHPTVVSLAAYLRGEAQESPSLQDRAARQRAALGAQRQAAALRRKKHG